MKLKSFTLRWSPERLEEVTIEGVTGKAWVSDYEVEDGFNQSIVIPGEGRIYGKVAVAPGPELKKRLEETMLACAKGVEKLLTEKGMFDPAPTVATFGLDVKEG